MVQLLTSIVLAVIALPSPSHLIAIGERVNAGVVVTASGVVITVTGLAGEGVIRGAISPRLVVVEGQASLTVVSLSVVQAVTD
jgi:hypothetical protein